MHASRELQAFLAPGDAAAAQPDSLGTLSAEVTTFLGRLRRIPADDWFRAASADGHIRAKLQPNDIAVPLPTRRRDAREDQLARARLRDVMDRMPAVARRIRRRIDEELTILDGIATVGTLTQMRRAARLAACAIAARPFLSAEDFERLYRPFDSLIPASDLAVH